MPSQEPNTLGVEDKNMFFTFFQKSQMVVNWLY